MLSLEVGFSLAVGGGGGGLGGHPGVVVRDAAELNKVSLDASPQTEELGTEHAHDLVRLPCPVEERVSDVRWWVDAVAEGEGRCRRTDKD
jgi:hypothetical protein